MNIEELRAFCLLKPEVTEELPFDENTLVFKVAGKMFVLTSLKNPDFRINLKCEPELAISLREEHPCVIAGYHMSKKHWNTVIVDGSVNESIIKEWINHSYEQVVSKLPKKVRDRILS